MKGKISINERTQISWMPKAFINNGFRGEVEYLGNAATIVLVHPRASLDEVAKSLRGLLIDIELRKSLAKKEALPPG